MKRYAVALATTAALVGAGFAIPQAGAQNETAAHAVAGLFWPDLNIKAGETKTLNPNTAPGEDLRVVGPGDSSGFRFSTNQGTGAITVTAPVNAYPGSTYSLPIQVHGKDGKIGEFTSTVTIVAGGDNQATKFPVSYDQVTVKEKGSATVARTGGVPDGTTFTVIGQPSGYTVTVDGSGSVTVKPAANLGAGSTGTARIKVTYPDTSYEYADVKIAVSDESGNTTPRADRDTAKYEPTWAPIAMKGDEAATSERSGGVPAGTTFKIREDLLGELTQSIAFTIDETSGTITVTPMKPLRAGLELNIPVQVTYPDGSSETLVAPMTTPTSTSAQPTPTTSTTSQAPVVLDVDWDDSDVLAGETVTMNPKGSFPEGTKFSINGIRGWDVSIDENTGVISATIPAGTNPGSNASPIINVYAPNSSERIERRVKLTVGKQSEHYSPAYTKTTEIAGDEEATIKAAGDFPPATTFELVKPKSGTVWTIDVNESTGDITFKPTRPMRAGSSTTVEVRATFPDGSTTILEAGVAITEDAAALTPTSTTPASTTAKPTPTPPKTTPTTTPTTAPKTSKPTVTISTTITPTWTLPVPTDLPTTSKKPTTGNQTPTVPTPGTTIQTPTDTNSADTKPTDTTQNDGSSGSSEGSSISTGGIIGIVVGVLALLGAAAAALGWWAAENGFLNF